MASGGARSGAGRKPKGVAQKILEGNPGRRSIRLLEFDTGLEIPTEPPEYFSDRAKDIYRNVHEWLKKIGCTTGILPYNLEEYAFCKARWIECEEKNSQHGLLVKDGSGKPAPSPFVAMASQYLRKYLWNNVSPKPNGKPESKRTRRNCKCRKTCF
ncbi:hypothetical protein FACS1894211_04110 [Clostridia bacterium]|nr:hypothetical protein FACS1894211_04110 [Clostridia bacterium]